MKIRSPCPHLTAALALGAAALIRPVPPGMTLLQESAPAAPPRVTPELLRERGVQDGQIDTGVSLHERAVHLGRVQVLEAIDGSEQVPFRANIAVCDIINLNWRYYPRSAYEGAIARAQADMDSGKLTALVEHPGWDDGWKGRLEAIGARWTRLYIEEKDIEWPPGSGQVSRRAVVVGEGLYTRTEGGLLIQQLIADGVFVGISTNGYSSVQWKTFAELNVPDPTGLLDPDMEIAVTGDDLTFLTIDFVALPANAAGQVTAESGTFAPLPARPALGDPPADPPPPPSPAHAPAKESTVKHHPKVIALAERLGKTVEQVKAEHATEYQQVLEEIAHDAQTLQVEAARVPGLTAEITRLSGVNTEQATRITELEGNAVRATRESLVDAALTAANLPRVPEYQDGDTTIDLNAVFREGLIATAVAASSDADAQATINARIAERAHLLKGVTSAPAPAPVREARITAPVLPAGNVDQTEPLQEHAALSVDPTIKSLLS